MRLAARSAPGRRLTAGTSWTFMEGSQGGALETAKRLRRLCSELVHRGSGRRPEQSGSRVLRHHSTSGSQLAQGTTWNDTTCGYSYSGAAGSVHVDQHALAFLPGSSSILLIGNDGGAHGTTNRTP